MSNSADASGSSFASSALAYEREMPQVSGSLSTNFIAFGFGVGSISAIFGMLLNHIHETADERRRTPIEQARMRLSN